MKKYILYISVLFSTTVFAKDKTISFIVSGSGKNMEQANNDALKSALSQAYICFS